MKSLLCTLASLFSAFCSFGQAPTFPREAVVEDLEYLYTSLKDAHYNLFAYTSQQEFDTAFQKIKGSIDRDSLNLLEATSTFQRLISVAGNGHTEIDFPAQSYMEYAYGGGTLFPLELAFEDEKSLVRKNWSGNEQIRAGDQVVSINGMPVAEVLARIYPQISAERPYFKNTKLELFSFPRYYWQAFGEQEDFEVAIQSGDRIQKHHLPAVPVIEGYEMKRTETVDFNPAREFKFIGDAAYLNPGNLSGEEGPYQKFIDSAFARIKDRKARDLIVDLRNNLGGDDTFSDYLVSYFADKPFKWNSSFTLRTSALLKEHIRKNFDTTRTFWQEALRRENGEIYAYDFEPYQPQPGPQRFTGNVYVLVNRQSHSQSAVTAAQIQDYGFGTIVGEETGDYPTLYASVFRFPLPNTGVSVQVAKGYIVRVNGSTKEEGVIPDLFIRDHLLDEKDEILEGLLRKLETR